MTLSIPLISTVVGSATSLPDAATLSLNPAITAIVADDAIVNSATIGNQALATSLASTASTAAGASTTASAAQSTANSASTTAAAAQATANTANTAVTALGVTVTSQGVSIANNTAAIAALAGGNYLTPASGAYGTWDPTGVSDCAPALQACINAALALSTPLPVYVPAGTYLLNSTVHLTPARNTTQSCMLIGQAPRSGVNGLPKESRVRFNKNFNNAPAFDATGYRSLYVANITIYGQNIQTGTAFPNRFDTNYVIGGARDSQYSPDCGFSLDGLVRQSSSVAYPPDGGWPSLSAFYSTGNDPGSNAFLENITCVGHVVSFGITLAGAGSLTDSTTFFRCNSSNSKVALAMCQSQSKITLIDGGDWGGCRTLFDTLSYGAQNGIPPTEIHGLNIGYCYEILNCSVADGSFNIHDCYGESFRRYGSWGNAGITNRGLFSMRAFQCTIYASICPPPPVLFEAFGPSRFESCGFTYDGGSHYSCNLVSDGSGSFNSPIVLENCGIQSQPTAQLMAFVGYASTNVTSGVRMRECYSGGTYPTLPMSDDSTNDISNFSWNNRVSSVGIRGQRYANSTGVVEYVSPNTGGVVSITVSALTITTTAITFTAAPAAGAVSANLTANWAGATNFYPVLMSNGQTVYALIKNGQAKVDWINTALSSSCTTAATVQNVTLTFTYSGTALQLGDILMWQHTNQVCGQSGSTNKRYVPTWIISTIAGSTYTCTPIVEASCLDTVANNPSNLVKVCQNQWAPYGQAFTAIAASSSTSLTSVTPATGILNGDWVLDTAGYLPANTRVVSGAGTGTLVLNNAATGSGATSLYFGRLSAPTLTPVW